VTTWILGQVSDSRKTYTTSYEYNGGSQLSMMMYPSGQQVSVNHDNKGRMLSLTYNPGDTTGYLTGMSYSIAGQATGLTLGNGVVESYGYDVNRLQFTSQTATKGATSLMNLAYNYQASAGQMGTGSTAGNAGQLMGISGTINSTTESASYTYDLVGRLATSNQTSNGSSAQRRFGYDRWGNRTGVWDAVTSGTQIQSITYPNTFQQGGSAPTNGIASVTNGGSTVNYTYDAAGNVTNDGVHSYTYDAENRIVSVDTGATAQYRYDHQNRRVCKIVGSTWTHYIWQGSHVIAEHDATTAYSTNPTYQVKSARLDYIYSGVRMIQSRQRATSTAPWTTRYFLSDRLSERMTLDSSGNMLGRQAHLPFGEDFGESGAEEKHHFTNYESDAENGLDYAVNRQYSQSIGRFNRPDALAKTGKRELPQTWNRYTYTTGDPINQTDPWGLFLCWGCGGPDDPCSPLGPTIFLDGIEMFKSFFCGVEPIPGPLEPDPAPDPAPARCFINVRISRAKRAKISAANNHHGDLTQLGKGENDVSDGFWWFFFEIEVFLPADDRAPGDWMPFQSLVKSGGVTISVNGQDENVDKSEVRPDDSPLEAFIDTSQTGKYYWLDSPDIQKVATGTDHAPHSVIGGNVFFRFEFTLINKKDLRRSCVGKLNLVLNIKKNKAKWAAN